MHTIEISNVIKEFTHIFADLELIQKVKTGKEAEVFLVEAQGKIMVLKSYRPNIKYASRHEYLGINEIHDKRIQKAIKHKSKIGKAALEFMWSKREYHVLQKLNRRGANVPKVYGFSANSVLMEYLGTPTAAAPRLSEVKLSQTQAELALQQIVDSIYLMLGEEIVHGDLSAFNILYWQGKPYVIDFPQAVNAINNPMAYTILQKDVANLRHYFAKYDCANLPLLDQLEAEFPASAFSNLNAAEFMQ